MPHSDAGLERFHLLHMSPNCLTVLVAGVFEGELFQVPGFPTVSPTLAEREALGANCGDPPNVPPDITCNRLCDVFGLDEFQSCVTVLHQALMRFS
jgi:hypothetical protein